MSVGLCVLFVFFLTVRKKPSPCICGDPTKVCIMGPGSRVNVKIHFLSNPLWSNFKSLNRYTQPLIDHVTPDTLEMFTVRGAKVKVAE